MNEKVNPEQVTQNSTNESINKILKFLEQGEDVLHNQYREHNVTLVLGNTGSGKSTFTQWITGDGTQLISKEDPNTLNGFIIYDTKGKIGNSITASQTLFPELMENNKTGASFYDFPGFYDTRGAANDIATTYFIKKVVDYTKSIKLLFLVNHNSVTNQGTRDDFTKLIKYSTKFVKNIDKFQNSIALIASRVSNAYSTNSDNQIIKFIANFIGEVREKLVQNTILSDLSDKEKSNALKFLDTLLVKDGVVYPKIGLFRSPNKEGPLSNITLLQENKKHIETLLEKLHFTTKTIDDFSYAIPDSSQYKISGIVEELNKKILINIRESGEEIKKYFSSKEETVHELKILYYELRSGYDKLLVTQNTAKLVDPKECIKQIKNNFTAIISSNSINQNLSNAINYSNYIEFLQTVSGQNYALKCSEGLNDVIIYLNNAQKWYHFLLSLYDGLSEYKIQEDTSTCNKLASNIIQDRENKKVADLMLEPFLKECYPQYEYNDIKFIVLGKSKLNALKKVLDLTLKHKLYVSCDPKLPNKLVIKGQYVKLSDISTNITCSQTIKFIEIFALNKIFIDANLDRTGKEIQLSIIAPTWHIQGIHQIVLDGEPGEAHNPAKARNGIGLGSNGEDGKPGLPGGSGGNFLGIGRTFTNAKGLTISSNGGQGGPGQHGGDGSNGKDGKDAMNDKNQFQCKDTDTKYFTPTESQAGTGVYNQICKGHDGGVGGNGGNGGIGGYGGHPGNIIAISVPNNINLHLTVDEGKLGLSGSGGHGGLGGKKGLDLYVRKFMAIPMIVTSTTTWYLDDKYILASPGKNGTFGYNSANIIKPDIKEGLINPSYTINNYKNYLRENLSGSIRESDLRDFLNLLEINRNIVGLHGNIPRSRRYLHGKTHHRGYRDIENSNYMQFDSDDIIVNSHATGDIKPVSSTASNVKSPINTAINWLSGNLKQLKFLNPANIINYEFVKDGIKSLFGVSKQLNSYATNDYSNNAVNVAEFNVNDSVILADFLTRCFTKVKPYNSKEDPINLLEVKAYALNIITEFEEVLNAFCIENGFPIEDLEFYPIDLSCKLEKEIINGNCSIIGNILYQSILNNNPHLDEKQYSSYLQDKIIKMSEQQNVKCSYQQLISGYTRNDSVVMSSMGKVWEMFIKNTNNNPVTFWKITQL